MSLFDGEPEGSIAPLRTAPLAERTAEQEIPSPQLVMNRRGYLEIADTGDRITPEMVKEASEDYLA